MSRGSVSGKRFETKKKNGISLRDDELLDTHFKPLKIGDEIAPIQLAKDEIRLSGDVFFDNPIKSRVDIEGHQITLSTGLGSDHYLKFETRVYGGTDYLHSYITTSTESGQGRLYIQPDGNLYLEPDGSIYISATTNLYFDGGGNTFIEESSADVLDINVGGNVLMRFTETAGAGGDNVAIGIDEGCKFIIPAGSSLALDGSGGTYIIESSDGVMKFYCDGQNLLTLTEGTVDNISTSCSIVLPATGKLHFDGSVAADTYIKESSADILDFYSGGDKMLSLDEANDKISLAATNWVAGTVSGATVTEFSAANSAYAGMILGYSVFRNATAAPGNDTIAIDTSMTVLETNQGNKINVSFVAPPSGKVEIIFSAMLYASSKEVMFSLSDNATYNEVDAIHTYDGISVKPDETDYVSLYLPFVVEGLTAGTSYQYWIAGDSSSASSYIYYGLDRAGALNTQPITFKAIALPATIVSEE